MRKIIKLWKSWWKRLWGICEILAQKLVENGVFIQSYKIWLWNLKANSGFTCKKSGVCVYCGGKELKIAKLFKSEVSTFST